MGRWTDFFCRKPKAELDRCKKLLDKCRETTTNQASYIEGLEEDVVGLSANNKVLKTENEELQAKLKKALMDVKWYEERLETYKKALEDAVVIPEIELDESELSIYKFEDAAFAGYDLRIADAEYYLLPYDKWIEILALVHKEVKEGLIRWRANISDCDNWADITASTIALTFVKAGLNKQGAFMIIWDMTGDKKHAYNAFMDVNGQVWIYEPQTNEIVGKLGETDGAYESEWIWFPGAQPVG